VSNAALTVIRYAVLFNFVCCVYGGHVLSLLKPCKRSVTLNTGCFTIVETKRQLLKPLSMTLFIFLLPDCHREIVNLSIY